MNTNLHAFVLEKLRTTRLTRKEISDGSGVALGTLNKIGTGATENPRVKAIEALANFFLSAKPAALGDGLVYPSAPAAPEIVPPPVPAPESAAVCS